MPNPRMEYTIAKITKDEPSALIIELEPAGAEKLQFTAGQFVMLHKLGAEPPLARPYSLASSPLNARLRFMIKITGGLFTSYLATLEVGARLGVSGPFGDFTMHGSPKKVVCICGGSGIAPMLGIMEHARLARMDCEFVLFWSRKASGNSGCEELIRGFSSEKSKAVITFTQLAPDGWAGERGRIDKAMVERNAGNLAGADVFICGQNVFALAARGYALECGAHIGKVRMEAWG
jgi:ferredoxin-NADP reductase